MSPARSADPTGLSTDCPQDGPQGCSDPGLYGPNLGTRALCFEHRFERREGGAVAITDDLGTSGPRAPDFDRQPPQDLQAEQSVLGGMLLSKDAIADVVEVLRSGDFYRPAHQVLYDTDPRPLRPRRAGRRDHRLGRADPHRAAAPARRHAVPAHADLRGADRRQCRLLRGDRRRAGDPAPAGRGRHPDRPARLRRRRRPGRRRRRGGRPRPGRDLRRHRAAHQRGLRPPRAAAAGHDGRDRRDLLPRRREHRRPHRLLRARPDHQRPAPRPDGHRGGETGDR